MKKQLIEFEEILKSRIESGTVENEVLTSYEKLRNDIDHEELIDDLKIYLYRFRTLLHSLGNILIGENKNLADVIFAWKLVKHQMLFREYQLYSYAIDSGNWEDFAEDIAYENAGFVEQIWALCGLYYFNEKLDWSICPIQLLKTAILRGDIDFNLKHNDEFPWLLSLVEFLYSDKTRAILIDQLTEFERFNFIKSAWHDDELFKQGIERLCLYHIDKSSQAYNTGNFYPVQHYALFPVWIYALDKCRERELGRSALPDTPLMAYGERVHSALYEQVYAPILAQLDDFYNSKYGSQNIDFYAFWKQFKGQ